MKKIYSLIYSLIVATALFSPVLPVMAWNLCCDPLELTVEARVAYYHPSSNKVRRIYGDGWTDYQLEVSKAVFCDWRIWAGVSGFSRKGHSIGCESTSCFSRKGDSIDCHDRTRLQLIPIFLGVKHEIPFCNNFKAYIGGAGCYSFLRIKDDSEFVRRHTHKNGWGGLIQAGITYNFWKCAYVNFFADYYFQEFRFHDSRHRHGSSSDSRFIERHNLDMNGYKLGVGLGYTF